MKTVLNIGAGRLRGQLPPFLRGYRELTLDIDPASTPDIVGDMRSLGDSVEPASMDAVYSSHSLEHIWAEEVPATLLGFLRCLKTDGALYLRLPDLEAACAALARGQAETPLYHTPVGGITALDILYGFAPSTASGQAFAFHKTGFTARSLARLLWQTGFRDIEVVRHICELHAVARKRPQGYDDDGTFRLRESTPQENVYRSAKEV